MSDRQGLLTLPMTEASDPKTSAVGDPILDVLASFLQASVNADVSVGWAAVSPRATKPHESPVPIAHVFTHNPDKSAFEENKLPAIFVWRIGWPRLTPYSQEWKAQVSQVGVLWVPSQEEFGREQRRDPMRNAIAKAMHRNLERGRNPAWRIDGDTDPKAEDYGSFVLAALNVAKMQALDIKPFPLSITRGDREFPYDALLLTIELTELLEPLVDDYPDLAEVRGTFTLGEEPLTYISARWTPTLSAVSPSSGPTAGGTAITLTGAQFFEDDYLGDIAVTVDDVACTDVAFVDETTITATTPAGTAGAKTVKVTLPSGASASLASAFTYA